MIPVNHIVSCVKIGSFATTLESFLVLSTQSELMNNVSDQYIARDFKAMPSGSHGE